MNGSLTVGVLEPSSKRSSYKAASEFLKRPSYKLHDIYRALDILGKECEFIQSEVYKNSSFIFNRNDRILYYDCSNYYPLAFSTFPGNANEQTSLKPLEQKVLREFGCQKFIYCSDAGLASEDIRSFNHMGERAFICHAVHKETSF